MEVWKEFSGKTVEEAVTDALVKLGATSDQIEYEVLEKESRGLFGVFSRPAKIRIRRKELTVEETAEQFLEKVFRAMEIQAKIQVNYDELEQNVQINIVGDDMGVLIGKRGQTLDSLQYLTSLVINKNKEGYLKVKLDTENYRERRKETLENLAKNIAYKVKRTHKPVTLEPMNPYERRIIHSALQNDKFVETHSEGEEPYRRVVVSIKKGVREFTPNNEKRFNRPGYAGKKYNNTTSSKKEFTKKYGGNSKDYSTDYKKDYAAYLEQKKAAKAAAESEGEFSDGSSAAVQTNKSQEA